MDKVLEATDAIKAAWDAVSAVVNPTEIMISAENKQVHVKSIRDVEQVPGKLEFCDFKSDWFVKAAYKELRGVRFFCLLTKAEYEELKGAREDGISVCDIYR
jgi:hypothetical protein